MGRTARHRHDYQLETFRKGRYLQMFSNSVFGLVDIYNLLPRYVVEATNVHMFQKRLQELLRIAARSLPGWERLYSPRNAIYNNELRKFVDWDPGNTIGSADLATTGEMITIVPGTATAKCVSAWSRFGS